MNTFFITLLSVIVVFAIAIIVWRNFFEKNKILIKFHDGEKIKLDGKKLDQFLHDPRVRRICKVEILNVSGEIYEDEFELTYDEQKLFADEHGKFYAARYFKEGKPVVSLLKKEIWDMGKRKLKQL